jgi:RNA polymerase sigma factor (sigma-70 family)
VNSPATKPFSFVLFAGTMEQTDPSSALSKLTAGLALGDDNAWGQFHRDYGPGLFRYLLASTRGDHDLATEALQQTYLRVARNARPCNSPSMFASWLRVVARSALSDSRRRRVSFWNLLRRRYEEPADISSPAEEEQTLTALDAAMVHLSADDRRLLEDKYLAGLSVRTLGEKLSLSTKAVESRLVRARATLRQHLLARLKHHD